MVTELFQMYQDFVPEDLKSYNPFKKLCSKDFVKTIPANLKDWILKQAKQAASYIEKDGWPQIYASLYSDFSRTGNRVNFENIYFKRRNFINLFVLAEFIEAKGNYLTLITDGLFLICEETGWQLPAHNSYVRDSMQYPYADSTTPVLDLFAGETAALLSTTYILIGKKLDSVLIKRIQHEIKTRIIEPYFNNENWWKGNDQEPMCNWTPWITQNVLLAAFVFPIEDKFRIAVVEDSLYSLDCFLKDYGEDGCCSEGAEYYRHAGLCLYNCMDIINIVTGKIINHEFKNVKIKNISEFIAKMHIPGTDSFFNFADCSRKAGKSGVREFLFGKQTKSKLLCNFAAEQWKISTPEEKLFNLSADSLKQSNLFYIAQTLQHAEEIENYVPVKLSQKEKTIYYKSNGLFIVHNEKFSLAVKAGDNADSHNHNDTGSIIIYKNKKPFIIDLGVESYTKKTFSPQRYEIWTMQSAWHNLPTVNGVMQKDGKKFAATNVTHTENSISFNMEKAYPKEALLSQYRRTVTAEENCITLSDSFSCKNEKPSVKLSLITCEKPEADAAVQKIKVGTAGTICFEEKQKISIEEVTLTDPRLRTAWPEKIWRITVDIKSSRNQSQNSTGTINIQFQ